MGFSGTFMFLSVLYIVSILRRPAGIYLLKHNTDAFLWILQEDLPTASSETTEKATGQKLGFKGFKLKESAFNKLCA